MKQTLESGVNRNFAGVLRTPESQYDCKALVVSICDKPVKTSENGLESSNLQSELTADAHKLSKFLAGENSKFRWRYSVRVTDLNGVFQKLAVFNVPKTPFLRILLLLLLLLLLLVIAV